MPLLTAFLEAIAEGDQARTFPSSPALHALHDNHDEEELAPTPPAIDALLKPMRHPRTVTTFGLFLLTFFNVSGGPWGSELIVSSVGPLYGFIALFAMAALWGLPMSLVTSELSSKLPYNGGYVLWVERAFGEFWGFQESFWSWGSCVVDNALYPVLAYETFVAMYSGDVAGPLKGEAAAANSWLFGYVCKLVLTVLFSLPVLLGRTDWVTRGMLVLLVLLSAPFMIYLPWVTYFGPTTWSNLFAVRASPISSSSSAGGSNHLDWIGLIHVAFWNFNGFDCASTCAGEVKHPGRSYPRGILLSLVFIVAMTFFPLAVATARNDPDWHLWEVGWWSAIANHQVGLWMAWLVVLSSLLGTLGMHVAVMWEDAWQLCGMAEGGMAPRWLAGRNEKLGTPQNATLISMLMVMCLIMFDFRNMVVVDNFFSVCSGLLELLAYAKLKEFPDGMTSYVAPLVEYDPADLDPPFSLRLRTRAEIWAFLAAPLILGTIVALTSFENGWTSFLSLVPIVLLGFAMPTVFRSKYFAPPSGGAVEKKADERDVAGSRMDFRVVEKLASPLLRPEHSEAIPLLTLARGSSGVRVNVREKNEEEEDERKSRLATTTTTTTTTSGMDVLGSPVRKSYGTIQVDRGSEARDHHILHHYGESESQMGNPPTEDVLLQEASRSLRMGSIFTPSTVLEEQATLFREEEEALAAATAQAAHTHRPLHFLGDDDEDEDTDRRLLGPPSYRHRYSSSDGLLKRSDRSSDILLGGGSRTSPPLPSSGFNMIGTKGEENGRARRFRGVEEEEDDAELPTGYAGTDEERSYDDASELEDHERGDKEEEERVFDAASSSRNNKR